MKIPQFVRDAVESDLVNWKHAIPVLKTEIKHAERNIDEKEKELAELQSRIDEAQKFLDQS